MLDFPATPTLNQQFSSGTSTWQWDGVAWNVVPQMTPAVASDTPPANPAIGQGWWRGTNGKYYLWLDDGNSKQWVEIGNAGAIPGAWEPIGGANGVYTLSGAAFYDFKDLGAFRYLRIAQGSHTPTSAAQLVARVSHDNGLTFDQGATDYGYEVLLGYAATASASGGATAAIAMTQGNDATVPSAFSMNFIDFNSPSRLSYLGESFTVSSGQLARASVGGYRPVSTPCNALRLLITAGTMTLRMVLEGVRG